jgi:hypothetical protein
MFFLSILVWWLWFVYFNYQEDINNILSNIQTLYFPTQTWNVLINSTWSIELTWEKINEDISLNSWVLTDANSWININSWLLISTWVENNTWISSDFNSWSIIENSSWSNIIEVESKIDELVSKSQALYNLFVENNNQTEIRKTRYLILKTNSLKKDISNNSWINIDDISKQLNYLETLFKDLEWTTLLNTWSNITTSWTNQ